MSDQSTSQNSIIQQQAAAPDAGKAPPEAAATTTQENQAFKWPENWKEHIDEQFRNEGALKNINDIPTLVKSYVHANKLIGADKIAKPGKYAKPEEWAHFYSQLGRPETPDQYQLGDDEKAFEANSMKEFLAEAHKMNLLPDQVKGMLKWYKGLSEKSMQKAKEQIDTTRENSISTLKKEWGEKYDANIDEAQRVYASVIKPEDKEINDWISESGIGDDARFIKLMSKFAPMFKEDSLKDGGSTSFGAKQAVQDKIKEIRNDQKHPANDRWHPDHQSGVDELNALYQKLYSN